MNPEFFKNKKALAVTAFVVIVILVVFWNYRGSSQNPSASVPTSGTGQNNITAPLVQQNITAPKTIKTEGVSIVSPVGGEKWLLSKPHVVRWSREVGRTGAIALLNASSRAVVGWLTISVTPKQVSYDWDTYRVSLSRTSPIREIIPAGTYIIQVVYDKPNSVIESAPFEIIAAGDENILTSDVYLRSSIFSPNVLTVKQGEHIVFVHDDGVNTDTIKLAGIPVAILSLRDSYVFDTSKFAPGNYEFRLASNPVAKLTLAVER